MKKKILYSLLFVFIILCVSAGVHAMRFRNHGFKYMHKMGDMLLGKLDLTDSQEKKINKIRDESKIKMVQTMADLKIMGIQLKSVLQEDTVDMETVSKMIDSIAVKKADMMKSHIKSMLDIKKELTPEQVKEFNKLKKKLMKKCMKRMRHCRRKAFGRMEMNNHPMFYEMVPNDNFEPDEECDRD